MARTKASVGAKVSSGKSSKARCCVAPSNSSSSSGSSNRSKQNSGGGGGNSVCARPTPKWQKPITSFYISQDPQSDDGAEAGSSKRKKHNIIESDDEDQMQKSPQSEQDEERPRNSVLDESIELEPLSGENSHKIEEYYPKKKDIQETTTDEENQTKQDHTENGVKIPINGVKGKGRGKKTNKENVNANVDVEKDGKRKSVKRDFDEISEDSDTVSKKIKVDDQ